MVKIGVLTKPGLTKLGTTKPGHSDMGLGLGNKVKDRVRDRAGDWYWVRVRNEIRNGNG